MASTSSTFSMKAIFRKHTSYLHLHLSSGDLRPTSYLCYCTFTHCQTCFSAEVWCCAGGHVCGSIWTGSLLMQALNSQLQVHWPGKGSPLLCHPPSTRRGGGKDQVLSWKQWNVLGRATAGWLGELELTLDSLWTANEERWDIKVFICNWGDIFKSPEHKEQAYGKVIQNLPVLSRAYSLL